MAQFFLIQCADPAERDRWYRLALEAFESLAGLRPAEEWQSGHCAAAWFKGLFRDNGGAASAGGRWACVAGTLLRGGACGVADLPRDEDALIRWLDDADGAFAVALVDEHDTARIVTDRLGTLHVYKAEQGGATLVSTSSLVLARLLQPAWDPHGARMFLSYGNVFDGRTLFAGIEKIGPARICTLAPNGAWREQVYWDLKQHYWDVATGPAGVEALADGLRRAFAAIGRHFPNAAMDLTGGFDSRALLGAALSTGQRYDTVVNGDPQDPDVMAAARISEEYRLRHSAGPLGFASAEEWWRLARQSLALTDGEYDVLLYAQVLRVHARTAGGRDASINGSNGEICKGYWWELLAPRTGRRGHFDARLVAQRRFAYEGEVAGLLAHRFDESLVDMYAGLIRRCNAEIGDYPNTAQMDNAYLALRMQRWQGRLASATSRLWPCLSPFAFRAPMEAALATPPAGRARLRLSRRLIEHFDPKLARLPLAEGYPASPLRLRNLHQHWRLGAEVLTKVWRAGVRRLAGPPAAVEPPTYRLSRLWALEEFRALLTPETMACADLFDRDVLRRVLEDSRTQGSPGRERVGRIVTLELLARAVRKSL